jgi:ribosomal protein S18 acetylase RimI-like enzyme
MEILVKNDCVGVKWQTVSEILKSVGMAYHEPERHKKAFEASYAKVFLFSSDTLIGFGRAISDGTYQAAVYDCAVAIEFQGIGFGRMIMENLLSKLQDCNVILYASPGKEGFYKKIGFQKMKTGMAKFIKNESMKERGFIE